MESSTTTLRKTPLHAVHREMGAKMVPFGGWEMPVEYAGLISEHMAVRRAAGLFDVSHMGELEVAGPGPWPSSSASPATTWRSSWTGRRSTPRCPTPTGAPVDDVIVYRRGAERYMIVVNASNIEKDFDWLRSRGRRAARSSDQSDAYALLALQGPRAQEILQPLTAVDLSSIAYYHFAEGAVDGHPATIARDGLHGRGRVRDLRGPRPRRAALAAADRGRAGRRACSRRDSARATRCASRPGCAFTGTTWTRRRRLVEAGLGWIVSLDEAKGDFPGRAVLEAQKKDGAPRKLVGFEMTGRGIARHGYPVFLDGKPVGPVTSGSYAPFLQKNIGLVLPAGGARRGRHRGGDRHPRPARAGAGGAHAVLQAPAS